MTRVLFFGSGKLSGEYLRTLQGPDFEIVKVIGKNIPSVSELKALNADIGIIAYYGKIIPEKILEIPKKKILNIHHSLLPRWRGPSPVQSAILAGDKKTGVTIAVATKRIDAGSIVSQKEINVAPRETYQELERRLIDVGSKLIRESLPLYIADKITLKPQDDSKTTYSKILTKEDGRIYWSRPAEEIERMVRALNPWPGVWTVWSFEGGEYRLLIEAAEAVDDDAAQAPGFTRRSKDGDFLVQTGKGSLLVKKLMRAGKKVTDGQSFLRGNRTILGSHLV